MPKIINNVQGKPLVRIELDISAQRQSQPQVHLLGTDGPLMTVADHKAEHFLARQISRWHTVPRALREGNVISGEDLSFYLRNLTFDEFIRRSLSTLLWQLYLLVPIDDTPAIKDEIRQSNEILDVIRQAQYRPASFQRHEDLPEAKTEPKLRYTCQEALVLFSWWILILNLGVS